MELLPVFLMFGVGMLAFCAPWVLPMLSAILGLVSGEATGSVAVKEGVRKNHDMNVLFLALGFTVTVMILGLIASFVGEAVESIVQYVEILAGINSPGVVPNENFTM